MATVPKTRVDQALRAKMNKMTDGQLLSFLDAVTACRFSFTRVLGSGTYGKVVLAHDANHDKDLALKFIVYDDHDKDDKERVASEVLIGKALSLCMWPPLDDYVYAQRGVLFGCPTYERGLYCVAMEVMEMDAAAWLRERSPSALVKKRALFGLLQQLHVMWKLHCVHRDIKPTNVLVRDDMLLLADFGSACMDQGRNGHFASGFGTFWYQALETFTHSDFTYASEMWSIGGVVYFVLTGEHLCRARDVPHLLELLVQLLGQPPASLLQSVRADSRMHTALTQKPQEPCETLEERLERLQVDSQGIDFVRRLLVWEPTKRLTVEQALEHPFFNEVREEAPPTPEVHSSMRTTLSGALLRTVNHVDRPFTEQLCFDYVFLKSQALILADDAPAAAAAADAGSA